MRRVIRAIGAALILILLVAGPPALISSTIGNPLDSWSAVMAGDFSDTVIVDLLAAATYLFWAQFTVIVVVELVCALARIRLRRPLPGMFGGQQQLAAGLIAAFLLTSTQLGTTASSGPQVTGVTISASAPAFTEPLKAAPTAADTAPTSRHSIPTKTYVITTEGPQTMWDLAKTFLGRGELWGQIWALNEGRHQPDGSVMTRPGMVQVGWTVLLPITSKVQQEEVPSRDVDVTVHAGDTLSEIAADHGHPDWKPVWKANAERTEPHGTRFTDPDHIEPGWTIRVPGRSSSRPAVTSAPRSAAAPAPPALTPPPAPPSALIPSVSPPSAPAPSVPSEAADPAPIPTAAASPRPAETSGPLAGSAPSHAESSEPGLAAVAAFSAGGALLAGVSLIALAGYRRRQFRYRRPGRAIANTPSEQVPVERALIAEASHDVQWLNEALRSLTQHFAGTTDGRLPDVLAARMTPDLLELVLATPCSDAPAPWIAEEGGVRWSLLRGAAVPFDPAAQPLHFAPYPALVSIGHTPEGHTWLLDLERIGILHLTGDPSRCRDLTRFIAAELAHNVWSEELDVTLVGFEPELATLNPDRLDAADDVAKAATSVSGKLESTTEMIDTSGVGVLDGRLRGIDGDLWLPRILLSASDTEPDADLGALLDTLRARTDRTAVAVVLTGAPAPTDRWVLHLEPDGTLRIPELRVELEANQLPADEAAQLAQLLTRAARTDDEPVPAARGDQPWEALTDATGNLLPHLNGTPRAGDVPRQATPGGADAPGESASSVLPLPIPDYLARSATTAQDVAALAPTVNGHLRTQIKDVDPTLDDDLYDWNDPDCATPKLTLLGPLNVAAPGSLPADRPRKAWNTEVVAYLACHPRGVTADQLGTDLWPGDPDIIGKSKLRQAIHIARRWLGTNLTTGREYLPTASNPTGGPGLYRVDGILIDADLFRRLRLRGIAGGPGGICDLENALALVKGPPFDQRRPGGYTWLAETPLDHEYTGMIIDVAHLVATHHLANGRPGDAALAAHTALLAGSTDDIALLDLLAAHDGEGNRAEADRLVRRIMTNHDAEVEEDLPPRTADILHRRRWLT